MISAALFFLALVFGLHITMVNLGIAFSSVVPILKRRGEKSGKWLYIRTSKELMKFYGATYALAGVFGTAFTVFLLSFYPGFIGLAGNITFVPFGIAILAIIVHFFAISAYWYGWDKWSENTHFFIGLILMASVYVIPFGFRAISAFLNIPVGLELYPKPHLDVLKALTNPTFLPLYLKSIFAALTAGFFTISSGYMYKYMKGDREAVKIVEKFLPLAGVCLVITAVLGIIYAETLRVFVYYKFENAFGFLVGASPKYDFSWLFILKLLMIALQVAALVGYFRLKKGAIAKEILLGGPAALIGIFAGEMLNSFSQYPYFVAKLADKNFVSAIPEPLRNFLAERLSLKLVNPLATSQALYAITIAFLVPLLISACLFLYLAFIKPERSDL